MRCDPMSAGLLAVPILLIGCAQQPEVGSGGQALAAIHYAVSACHGTCPVYTVETSADGTTVFDGERFTATEGERVKHNDPATFTALRARLATWRPADGATQPTPDCGPRVTDLSQYTVTWITHNGEESTLEHDSGCRSVGARQLTDALKSVPELLEIEDWVQR